MAKSQWPVGMDKLSSSVTRSSMRTTYMQGNGKSHGRQGRVYCDCETRCSHLSMTMWHPLWNLHSLYIYGLILKGVYY